MSVTSTFSHSGSARDASRSRQRSILLGLPILNEATLDYIYTRSSKDNHFLLGRAVLSWWRRKWG
jgi:hypothetical protein